MVAETVHLLSHAETSKRLQLPQQCFVRSHHFLACFSKLFLTRVEFSERFFATARIEKLAGIVQPDRSRPLEGGGFFQPSLQKLGSGSVVKPIVHWVYPRRDLVQQCLHSSLGGGGRTRRGLDLCASAHKQRSQNQAAAGPDEESRGSGFEIHFNLCGMRVSQFKRMWLK